jgi:hypothetical protein
VSSPLLEVGPEETACLRAVTSRAPAIHNPPTLVPTLMDKEDTPVIVLTNAANGPGRSVLPEDATGSGELSVERIWSAEVAVESLCRNHRIGIEPVRGACL